jgi:hypothetical protein
LIILIDLLVIDANRNWNALTESLETRERFYGHQVDAAMTFCWIFDLHSRRFHCANESFRSRLSVADGEGKINYALIETFTHKIRFDLLRIDMEN